MIKRAPAISGARTLNQECFMRLVEGSGELENDWMCGKRPARQQNATRALALPSHLLQYSTNVHGTSSGNDQRNHQKEDLHLLPYRDSGCQPDGRRCRYAGVSPLPYPTILRC